MDRYEPDHASIFARRDDDDGLAADDDRYRRPERAWEHDTGMHRSQRAAARPPYGDRRHGIPPPPPGSRRRTSALGQQPFVVIAAGVVTLAFAGLATASLLAPGDPDIGVVAPSTSAISSATAAPSATAAVAPTSSETAASGVSEPTPSPTPVGPPHELTAGGWATVAVDELNVRSEPGLDAEAGYRLIEGAVVSLAEEAPTMADGLAWYRVASLGGARGWAASGPASSPFLEMLAESEDLLHCGRVETPILAMVDGTVEPADSFYIAGAALPAAAFSEEVLGGLELLRATRDASACITAVVGPEGMPEPSIDLDYSVCGRIGRHAGGFAMEPVAEAAGYPTEMLIKDRGVLHPALFARAGEHHPMTDNFAVLVAWAAGGDDTACWSHRTGASGRAHLDLRICALVHGASDDLAMLRRTSADDLVTFDLTTAGSYVDPALAHGEVMPMLVTAIYDDDAHIASLMVYPSGEPC